MNRFLTLFLLFFVAGPIAMVHLHAQRPYWEYMHDSVVDLDAASNAFEQFWLGKEAEKGQGAKQFRRWEYHMDLKRDASGKVPPLGYAAEEYERWKLEMANDRRTNLTPSGNWTPMGPIAFPANMVGQPGGIARTTTIAFHPTDPLTMIAGTPNGGAWRSIDGGASWTAICPSLPTGGVSAILIDPSNPNVIYLGTGDKDAGDAAGLGVYKSINAGATWTVSNTGMGNRTVHSMTFDPSTPTTLIAATTNGVYRSINSGANWTQTLAAGTIYDVRYVPGSTSTLYAINNARLYKSTDDGATWNAGTLVSTTARAAMGLTPADPNVVYVVKDVGANPVFFSNDGGATFTNVQVDGKVLLNGSCAGTGTGGQGWYDITIAVDPTNINNVIVGGVSLWKSVDGGANFSITGCWSSMATNIHADHHWTAWSPHVAGRLYICNDGGVYYTDNLGVSYTNISSGISASQIYRVAVSGNRTDIAVAGFQDQGMMITRQPNWYITVGGDGLDCAIDPTDNNFQYGSYVNGVIRRSTNGGWNWSTIANSTGTGGVNETGPWLTPYILQPGNPNVMLAGYVSIWRCTNVKAGAPAFTNVFPLTGSSIRDFGWGDANTVYCSRANGEFYSSVDAGLTWTLRTNPPGGAARDIAVDPVNSQNLWVASGNDIYRSTNYGVTWTIWDTGLPNLAAMSVVYDKVANALYAGMDIGVYYRHTTDPSWSNFSTGLPTTEATHLQIFYDQNGCVGRDMLRLGTYGRGMWESDLRAGTTLAPVACFGADTTVVCAVAEILQLRDSSAYDPTSWLWTITGPGSITYFGGTSSTSQNPQVSFGAPGLYTITLDATNVNGTSTNTRVNYILATLPTVAFTSPDSLMYVGQTATFTDASSDCVSSWLWDFGDGTTSTLENPTHVYATAGYFTVTLTVNGGSASLTRTNYIQVLPHVTVPYTSVTAGWAGDMESDALSFHFGDKRIATNNTWERGSVTLTFPAAASGTKCWATRLGSNVPVQSYSAAVLTPTFDMSAAGTYQLRIKTVMNSVWCNAPIGAKVDYTTDLGATWTRLGGKQGTDPNAFFNWYTHGATGGCDNIDVVPGNIGWNYNSTAAFRQAIFDASALAGNPRVGFRVSFYSSSAYGAFTSKGFAFDDFELDFAASSVVDTIPGNLINFDGVNDYVETYYNGNHSNFTLEGWVMSPSAPSGAARSSIIWKNSVAEFNWNHPAAASRGAAALRNSAGTWFNCSFGALAANTWYHLAVTFDGTNIRTYKNGILVTTTPFTGTLTSNSNTWQMGNGSGYFNGQVDEFRVWNTVRTQLEIREAMHRTLEVSELANVVIYYQSNETSGYLRDAVRLRNGYLMNGLGRAPSPIGVGRGVSQSTVVTAPGVYNFPTCGLSLNFTSAAGTPFDVTVTRIHQFVNQQTPNPVWNAAPNTALVDYNPLFYHVVNKFGGGAFSTNVTVNQVPGITPLEAATPSTLWFVKRPSNSVTFWEAGIPAVAATASSGPLVMDGSATFNAITSFSQAFIGSTVVDVLDMEELQFVGMHMPASHSNWLRWEMADESDVERYILTRTEDLSKEFESIHSVNAGGSGYSFEDQELSASSKWYYRVVVVNVDGSHSLSEIVELSESGDDLQIQVYPNPATLEVNVDVMMQEEGPLKVEIFSADGRQVASQELTASKGIHHQLMDLSGLSSGLYQVRVTTRHGAHSQKLVISGN